MHYAEHDPPPLLRGLVRCAWELSGDPGEAGAAEPALPDGSPELIVNLAQPFEHVPGGGPARVQPKAFLVGQITRPFVVRPTGRVELVALRLEAHGAALLHRSMRELTEGWRPLDGLSNPAAPELAREVAAAAREDRIPALFAAMERVAAAADPPDRRVARAVRAIRTSHGGVRLDTLTAELGLTPRTLQRLFADSVGISPKLLARIARFQRVFAAVHDEPESLARVAVACGYYDQSHLVRDFRQFAGEAPARMLTAMPAFTALFTA